MEENRDQVGHLWDRWSKRKHYNRARLELYYRIRERNLLWLTSLSFSMLAHKTNPRVLKTDLWNEAKKAERFFVDAQGLKFGIDVSNEICKLARSNHGEKILLAQASIESLPFPRESFDLVWDISTIDHHDHPEKVIGEYQRVLKQGGILLLIGENPFCLSYPVTKIQSFLKLHVPFKAFLPSRMIRYCQEKGLHVMAHFKTNVHLPTFVVYFLEQRALLEGINQGGNVFWNLCKKYFVVLSKKV